MIDDLIANLDADPAGDVLCSPLRAAWSFTSVLAAIQDRPGEQVIPELYQRITPTGRTVAGIEDAVVAAAEQGLLFSELNLPWAVKEFTCAPVGWKPGRSRPGGGRCSDPALVVRMGVLW